MANLFNFKVSLFGYKKKDVMNQINNMNEIHAVKIKEKEQENKELLDKYKELEQKCNELAHFLKTCAEEKEAATSTVSIVMADLAEAKTELAVASEREKMLSAQIEDLTTKLSNLEELKAQKEVLASEKEKIAQAWIVSAERADTIIKEAHEKASNIVKEAILSSEAEKKAIELKTDVEREKLIDLKREMRDLKNSFVSMLHRYGEEIDSKIGEVSEVVETTTETAGVTDDFDAGIPELPSDFGISLRPESDEESSNVLSFSDYMSDSDNTSITIL